MQQKLDAWSNTKETVIKGLNSDPVRGLSQSEAGQRLKQYGPNKMAKERQITFWGIFREESKGETLGLVYLLVWINVEKR